ncbi:hypothetical protein [Microbulbifer zhoushanensis]|uniref:hypothetical protein n=1 Tax=Microbulbifer zhoushanensis TaxID=2904254 RepID=UPI001F2EB7B3|nr:hypothetical protein [Microbulbifer zhoushanensis]
MDSCTSPADAPGFLELQVREKTLLELLAGRRLVAEDLRAQTPGARRQLRRLLLQSLCRGPAGNP